MQLNVRVYCRGTSTNENFNKPRWIDVYDVILNKYFKLVDLFTSQDFVVQLNTGLQDSMGMPIFEGDIVRSSINHESYKKIKTVKWKDSKAGFNLNKKFLSGELLVIGNIFEGKRKSIEIKCVKCHKNYPLEVNADRYKRWRKGEGLIQEMLPDLSPDYRELLLSGWCGFCYDNFFNSMKLVED